MTERVLVDYFRHRANDMAWHINEEFYRYYFNKWYAVEGASFDPLDQRHMRELDDLILHNMRSFRLERINFFDMTGRIIYSTRKDLVGGNAGHLPQVQQALKGEAVSRAVYSYQQDLRPPRPFHPALSADVIEIYIPMVCLNPDLPAYRKQVGVIEVYQDINMVRNWISQIQGYLAGMMGTLLALAIGSSFVALRRSTIRPLRQMMARIETAVVVSDGRLVMNKIEGGETYELNSLADSFNRMAQDAVEKSCQLEALGQQHKTIVEASQDCIILCDAQGRCLNINPYGNFVLELGSPEEVIGLHYAEIWGEPYRAKAHEALQGVLHGAPVIFEAEASTRRSQVQKWWHVILSPVCNDQGEVTHFIGVSRDITQHKRAEEAERRNRKTAESLAEAILCYLETEDIHPMAEIILQRCLALTQAEYGVVCDVRRKGELRLLAASEVILPVLEERASQKEGFFCVPMADPFLYAMAYFQQPLLTNDPASHPYWEVLPEGLPPVAALLLVPLKVQEEVVGLIGLANRPGGFIEQDQREVEALAPMVALAISRAQMEEERKALQRQLLRSQRMEATGRLAGGMAHDFNNLLTVIISYGELLSRRVGSEGPLYRDVEQILRASHRATDLTRQLLAFSRKQVMEPRVLDLNQILTDLSKMLRRVIGEDVDLVVVPTANLGRVRADAGQIEQVIVNLVVNARDAMPEGGRLALETANVELDEDYARIYAEVTPGRYVQVMVSDTGCGMTDEVMAHLFEPFFTTKGEGKGTGLGLSTVYGIVKQHGGHIGVYSEPGKGTSFKIYLPRVDEPVKPVQNPVWEELPRGSETLLLVEDEEAVRAVATRALEGLGYQVLSCRSGEEALDNLVDGNDSIDLLITDIILPGINGKDLADRVREISSVEKVLYVSGYTGDAVGHQGLLEPGSAFLQKPFNLSAIARKVREVLDG
ncbi:MAG: PAS domain-containing protein [Candidatus Tectomicrobia bacterium]|uniref:histidine kinase n=1 Tax=Tectimicrobiota bacterium TaxID=2528274 RepID=A0A932FW99_UNCTE|nr:PAS domain-containing protein [Candidatus Tectomicrobia bacterium]